ncbi:DUF1294 domain-containing protein [Paenibacillus chitinolyticus]|uniref:DUF1294 domain-containing protein n=1 Tax=Paenibacillus chitinolyticus TaxID=79263 RepID=UPI001C47EA1F|nr:DUF1294 domain-containing protein [Paenibacillus chitinolyticus]
MFFIKILVLYLLVVNLVAYVWMGADKRRARSGEWRVPEKRLFLTALIGGAPGIWAGMYAYKHKTRHFMFKYGIPLLLIVNVIVFWKLFRFVGE